MMTFFPVPHEDEILYSVLARFCKYSGSISLKSSLDDIYGFRSITSVMDLPSHMDRLISNMPLNNHYSSDELIEKHTLYNFYSAFLPPERAEQIKDFMRGDNGGSIYNKIGLMASSITLNKYFKFCECCVKEDLEKYGEIYWHRVHQISGALICPKHKVILQDSKVLIRGFNKQDYVAATQCDCRVEETNTRYSEDVLEKLNILSNNVDILLNHIFVKRPIDWFLDQYINVLMKLGFANINGKIKQKDLIKSFKEYYDDEFLMLFQSNFDVDSEFNWLSDLTRRKNKTTHPIRHLLFIQFLGINIDELFISKIEYKPFGDGPWPCLNQASDHYKKDVICKVKIKYNQDAKRPIGYFACDCGFVYTRTGPDVDYDARYKMSSVKVYGEAWMKKLSEYVAAKRSTNSIAILLNVDPATVKKYSCMIYGYPPCSCCDISSDINISIEYKDIKQNEWLNLEKKHPNESKTNLRKMYPKQYIWLYRNCNKWLINNSPIRKEMSNKEQRLDWEQRDNEILLLVEEKIKEIRERTGKPVRITISLIGSELGIRPLLDKNIDKLPKTRKYLNENTESINAFHIIRIEWAIQELKEENEEIKLWRVYRKAGIRMEYQERLTEQIKYKMSILEKIE